MAGQRPTKIIKPQEGYQMTALSSPADILIGGGAAGVGKTFTLLLEPLRHVRVPGFGAVTFRRTTPQIRNEGGLWDTSMSIFPHVGGIPRQSSLDWEFPIPGTKQSTKHKFAHLEYEKNIYDYQGAQIPLINFDELTHFTKKMFLYMLTRNRSVCGVKPYMRATCNPDPGSWVAELIAWWIDEETGYPIPERDGVLRYFTAYGDKYIWGDSYEDVIEKASFYLLPMAEKSGIDPKEFVKSITFVSGSIYHNKALLEADPSYLGNLAAQDEQTRLQLMDGCWKMVANDLDIYDYAAFNGMFDNMYEVDHEGWYITADIAMQGSDKMVVYVWHGWELVDIMILPKTQGPDVINAIKHMAKQYKVQNQYICFDNDGVGSFVDGFIVGAVAFTNNATPLPDPHSQQAQTQGKPENYEHLKAQCYYRSGKGVKQGKYRVSEAVASKMYDDKMTVRQRMIFERQAIKRAKADDDGKLRIIKKSEMKVFLGGQSPDMMDAFMMREMFNLQPVQSWDILTFC